MKKPETKLKEKVLKDLRDLPHSWWVKTQQRSIRGTPDILGCKASKFIAIELKSAEKAIIHPLQSLILTRIKEAKGFSYVVNPENWSMVLDEIRRIV